MVCLVAATLLWPALAQAPGDRDFRQCGEDDHTYPPEWHVVYDTWNYEELFDKGPLRTLNEDGGSGVSVLYLISGPYSHRYSRSGFKQTTFQDTMS